MWSIPLFLLVAVAIHHRRRIKSLGQSPWKGGSFAMFSETQRTCDITEIWVEGANGTPPLLVADSRENYLRRKARAIPTEKNMLAWAHWVARMDWVQSGESAYPRSGAHEARPLALRRVVVRHCERDFDCTTGTHTLTLRNRYSIDGPFKRR